MSSFQVSIAGTEEIAAKITASTVTTVVDGTSNGWIIPWMSVGENNGSTPNLTVELYDGTTSYYLQADGFTWVAKAVTAKQSLGFDDLVVPLGWKIRVTSSDASGRFDVVGIKVRRTT